MKFGVNLLNFGPGATPDSLSRWTRFAEAVGFHFVMVSDHVAITPDVAERYPAPFYEPFTTLSWLSGITDKMELGTTVVIVPYRNPIPAARMGANLDRITGGRFIFGVGAGWARREFEALGIPFHQRGAITDDYLAAIKALWTNDIATYEGRFVSFREVGTTPRPVTSPHPPIWVGGSSEAALRRSVRFGDAWHPIRFEIDWIRDHGLPNLRRIADNEGRAVPSLCPRMKLRLTASILAKDRRLAGEGTMDQVRRDLETLQSLGADYVLLDTYFDDPEGSRPVKWCKSASSC